MKVISTFIACLIAGSLFAQTIIDKSVPVNAGQALKVHFDYPELVKISTWDKNEISVKASVSINGGENDDAFKLDINTGGKAIEIKNEIKNMDGLPHRVTVNHNGMKMVFRNQQEWEKYSEEHGKPKYSNMNMGIDMDIIIEIKVPVNMETSVTSVYGMVEVKEFKGPLSVQATYGGVDVTLNESATGELIAETNYGHIYSGLKTKFQDSREEDFHTYVSAKPGSGPKYRFESPYGSIYLRKDQ